MFITFEGIEGAGKTTLLKQAGKFLMEKGLSCIMTREPGGTEIGIKVREILLDPKHGMLDPVAELMLYTADRIQHVKEVIQPALHAGKIVLCDRFLDATVAYQGYGRGLALSLIHTLHAHQPGGITPDLTFLLDLPVRDGLARAWARIGDKSAVNNDSRFEEESLSFHEKVRQGYLKLAEAEPSRIRVIDAAAPEERVCGEVRRILSEALFGKRGKWRAP